MEKKHIAIIATLVAGVAMLAIGLAFLIINLTSSTPSQDGEYLVSAENWVLENEDGVVWDFTEIGKGTLTTNNHQNDYGFIWAIEDNKLKIETDWLYNLENEYEYSLDQRSGVLTLKDGDSEKKFIANFENE